MSKKEVIQTKTTNNDTDATSKIEVIKNLIFGENIQAYNSEFDALKDDILKKKELLEGLIEDVRTELTASIDSVATDINIRITNLEKTVEDKVDTLESKKVDKKLLGELLIGLGEKISNK